MLYEHLVDFRRTLVFDGDAVVTLTAESTEDSFARIHLQDSR